jgi:circadian clock protein KaiC
VTIQRDPAADVAVASRLKTGISKLDDLFGDGIPRGSSVLVAGNAGTGKTLLLLELLYRGAVAGEKGIMFSFEETEERLRATARGFRWHLDAEIERGMVEIVSVAQPNILVEADVLMMKERIEAIGAKRVAIDSLSVFLHKLEDPPSVGLKVFQLATIVQNAGAVGFFATDIPYGSNQLSRTGIEETVVDGAILLSAMEEGLERRRYLEIYKLRNTAHLTGRHNMVIGADGITIFPRYAAGPATATTPSRTRRGAKRARRS